MASVVQAAFALEGPSGQDALASVGVAHQVLEEGSWADLVGGLLVAQVEAGSLVVGRLVVGGVEDLLHRYSLLDRRWWRDR